MSKRRPAKRPLDVQRTRTEEPTKEADMRYLVLAYGDQKKMEALTKEQFEALVAKCKPLDDELKRSGHYVSGDSLEWATTSIRTRGGKMVVTDGPFVESKEKVGGIIVIEARDLNEAIRVASMHPAARLGEEGGWFLELRPYSAQCHQ